MHRATVAALTSWFRRFVAVGNERRKSSSPGESHECMTRAELYRWAAMRTTLDVTEKKRGCCPLQAKQKHMTGKRGVGRGWEAGKDGRYFTTVVVVVGSWRPLGPPQLHQINEAPSWFFIFQPVKQCFFLPLFALLSVPGTPEVTTPESTPQLFPPQLF